MQLPATLAFVVLRALTALAAPATTQSIETVRYVYEEEAT